MVVNDAEPAVSNRKLSQLLQSWQKHNTGNLSEVHFEAALNLPHDIITPGTHAIPIEEIQQRLLRAVQTAHTKSA